MVTFQTKNVGSNGFTSLPLCLPIMEASGFTPNRSATCLVMSTTAAAPSFSVLALAAVTVPEE